MKRTPAVVLAAVGISGSALAQVGQRTNEVAPGLPGRAKELMRMSATPTPPPNTPVVQPFPHGRCWWRPGWRQIGSGSGVELDASYRGDRWRLNVRVGSPGDWHEGVWGLTCHPKERWPYYSVIPAGFTSGWIWVGNSWRWHDYDSAPIGGYGVGYTDPRLTGTIAQHPSAQPAAGAAAPSTPPEPPSAMELALYGVYVGDSAGAVKALRDHLREEPEDVRAMRLLAFVLVETRKTEDAAAVMNLAYRKEPQLAFEPLDAEGFGFDKRRLRELANATVTAAHRARSGPGWLLVAVAMQAEGRNELAGRMLERGIREGLNQEVAEAMAAALKQ